MHDSLESFRKRGRMTATPPQGMVNIKYILKLPSLPNQPYQELKVYKIKGYYHEPKKKQIPTSSINIDIVIFFFTLVIIMNNSR